MAHLQFILVHSPFAPWWTWCGVANCLQARGHVAAIPALRLVGEADDYRRCAQTIAHAAAADAEPVLVVHSGAGGLAASAAEQLGGRTRGVIFVDAILPHPAQSWLGTLPDALRAALLAAVVDGRLPPWNRWFPQAVLAALLPDEALRRRFEADTPQVPLAYGAEPAPGWNWRGVSAYLRLSPSYKDEAASAEQRGWPCHRVELDHLAVLTRPTIVAEEIERLALAMV